MGMNRPFDIHEISDFMQAISEYKKLASYFPQLSGDKDKINSVWKTDEDSQYWNCNMVKNWDDIEIHITKQMWGSTACGWGGIGGAAMTMDYNYIIHQKYTDLLFVYWSGKLAYICKKDNIQDLSRMPGLREGNMSGKQNVEFIYKSR